MTSLTEFIRAYEAIEIAVAENNGELTPELESALVTIEGSIAQKIDGYHYILERLDNGARFYKEQEQRYAKMRKAHERAYGLLSDALKAHMQKNGILQLIGNSIRFVLSKTVGKLIVDDEKAIPDKYTTLVRQIDNTRIKEDLKLGVDVNGAHLEETYSLRTYAIKSVDIPKIE